MDSDVECDVYFCIQNAAEVGYCRRGCRLMRLADFANYSPWRQDALNLLQTCSECEWTWCLLSGNQWPRCLVTMRVSQDFSCGSCLFSHFHRFLFQSSFLLSSSPGQLPPRQPPTRTTAHLRQLPIRTTGHPGCFPKVYIDLHFYVISSVVCILYVHVLIQQ